MFLVLEWVDAGLIAARFSCSLPATTRLLLPNSCWPPDILLAVRSVKSARRSWLARISGCSWEQPPSYILGPRSRAGSRLFEGGARLQANPFSKNTNQRAVGDGASVCIWCGRCGGGLKGMTVAGEHRRASLSDPPITPLHRCKDVGGGHAETRIAAAVCAGDVARACYRFTRPGEVPTTPPTWTGPPSRALRPVGPPSGVTVARAEASTMNSNAVKPLHRCK